MQHARQNLVRTVDHLDKQLKDYGEIGDAWRKYLHWGELQENLAKQTPDPATLDAIYLRFDSGQTGLNWQMFTDVRHALRKYLITARAMGNPKLAQHYPKVLDLLTKYLRAYQEAPNPQVAHRISAALRWLEDADQADDVVQLVLRRYGSPNFCAEASPSLFKALIGRTVDETGPVQDCILGTSISGTGHTTGSVTVELIPSNHRGILDVLMVAETASDSIGLNRQVHIYSTGTTQHASRKRVVISDAGFVDEPAATNAVTSSRINCVQANRDLVERIARRRASQQQGEANLIASQHAEQRINARLDQQIGEQIADTNRRFNEQLRQPLERLGLFPTLLNFSTTGDALHVVALQAFGLELGASNAAPSLGAGADLGIRIHESAINNFAQGFLGGMTIEESQLQKDATDALGYLPEELKNPEGDAEPWAITFAKEQPITVAFGKDTFSVTIRGVSYTKGTTPYPGMNVTVDYDIKQTDQGPRAVRQSELEIFPPGFDAEGGQQLSTREQVLRRMLQRRFDNVFPKEIVPKPTTPKGELAKVGPLVVREWRSADGWMLLGWQRDEAKAQP